MNDNVSNGRHGVVGVVLNEGRFLVIRRSQFVRAPGLLCFPGGHIEAGESFEEAIRREMQEELELSISVRDHLWSSTTSWGTKLEWMLLDTLPPAQPRPNPREVAEVLWMNQDELLAGKDVLGSVFDFFNAIQSGQFSI